MKWTIKTENFKSIGLTKGGTKEEAIENFLKRYPEYKDKDTEVYPTKRYSYSVTEEGVFNPKYAGKFCGGRVEVFDVESDNGYAVYEWRFLMPYTSLSGFRDWIEDVETDYPIMINADFNMDTLEYE